jgi:hypothetical protein
VPLFLNPNVPAGGEPDDCAGGGSLPAAAGFGRDPQGAGRRGVPRRRLGPGSGKCRCYLQHGYELTTAIFYNFCWLL